MRSINGIPIPMANNESVFFTEGCGDLAKNLEFCC